MVSDIVLSLGIVRVSWYYLAQSLTGRIRATLCRSAGTLQTLGEKWNALFFEKARGALDRIILCRYVLDCCLLCFHLHP